MNIFFWSHSGVTLWCDFQCLTSYYSHSFSLCSLKILQWFVRRPDEDGLSASLLKQWSYMKDYIKDVSLPPTFLILHFVVCFSRWMHACASHSFSLCSLKILQWFVRRPDEDGLSASLLKQWSYMKDYIKDVSLPPTFLIVHFVFVFLAECTLVSAPSGFFFLLYTQGEFDCHILWNNFLWMSFAHLSSLLTLVIFCVLSLLVHVTLVTTNVYLFIFLFNHFYFSIYPCMNSG